MNTDFWKQLDELIASSKIVIDRPKGTAHPRYPQLVYQVDYGYLENTSSMDGGGIDLFKGTSGNALTGIFVIVDTFKRDSEIKLLIGVNESEFRWINSMLNGSEYMKGLYISRDE